MFDRIFEHVAGRVWVGLKDFGYIFWLDFSVCLADRLVSVSYLLSLLEIGLGLRISRETEDRMALNCQRTITKRQQTSNSATLLFISFIKPSDLYRPFKTRNTSSLNSKHNTELGPPVPAHVQLEVVTNHPKGHRCSCDLRWEQPRHHLSWLGWSRWMGGTTVYHLHSSGHWGGVFQWCQTACWCRSWTEGNLGESRQLPFGTLERLKKVHRSQQHAVIDLQGKTWTTSRFLKVGVFNFLSFYEQKLIENAQVITTPSMPTWIGTGTSKWDPSQQRAFIVIKVYFVFYIPDFMHQPIFY